MQLVEIKFPEVRGARNSVESRRGDLVVVVDDAVSGKPSIITRNGRPEAVVIEFEEWERLVGVPSFGRLLMSAPIAAEELPERNRPRGRVPP